MMDGVGYLYLLCLIPIGIFIIKMANKFAEPVPTISVMYCTVMILASTLIYAHFGVLAAGCMAGIFFVVATGIYLKFID